MLHIAALRRSVALFCEPWRLYEYIYQECFEFGFKHHNARKMQVPVHCCLLTREKKHCKTSPLTGISCGSLISHTVLSPSPLDGTGSAGAGRISQAHTPRAVQGDDNWAEHSRAVPEWQ